MKKLMVLVAVFALVGATYAAEEPSGSTGFSRNTTIIEAPTPDGDQDCPILKCNADGTFENGYCWQFGGAVLPDYGAWAECYENTLVCEGHFYFTQTGYYIGQTVDAYIWEDAGGNPGNVLCATLGANPGPIAFWPSCSAHKIPFDPPCAPPGSHFVGFWGNWPDAQCGWFICSDEDGFAGCPRTKIAPGIGYPTGWNHPNVVPTFAGCQSLGICEWSGEGGTATQETTWGQIKALY
jgi:hypothetical protein